jgi:hypothetical protein
VASSCEHGDEPSGSIKCREFLDQLSVLLASQEGLCCMELVLVSQVFPSQIREIEERQFPLPLQTIKKNLHTLSLTEC